MNDLSPIFGQSVSKVMFASERIVREKAILKRSARDHGDIHEVLTQQIQLDLESLHGKVRKILGYKRRELAVDLSEPWVGRLTTPDFEYWVRATVGGERGDEVHWSRHLSFQQSDALENQSLVTLLAENLDSVVISFSQPIDIPEWIDRLEEKEAPGISLDYDLQCRWCELTVAGVSATLRIEGCEVKVMRQPGTELSIVEMLALLQPQRFGI